MSPEKVPFLDLTREEDEIESESADAFLRVLRSGRFILGDEVEAFEREFASYCGTACGVGVASGTDALVLALKSMGIGPGDEVLLPAFSAAPTAVAVALAGASPIFVDIDPLTFNIDPDLLEASLGPRSRCVLAVHLYGGMADMPRIVDMSEAKGLSVLEDCAQAHGAAIDGKKAGSWGQAGAYSFYPTKNLGAYGDGGMVVTSDAALAARLRGLRDYGKASRDELVEIGLNSRLDELHAAILRIKLGRLEIWNGRRRELAARYIEGLQGLPVRLPAWRGGKEHCFHLFVIACEERDRLAGHLVNNGIGCNIHYSVPLNRQKPFTESGAVECPEAERAAKSVLSLPLYPGLTDDEQDRVIEAVRDFFKC